MYRKTKHIWYLMLIVIFTQLKCSSFYYSWRIDHEESVAEVYHQYWYYLIPMEVLNYKFSVNEKEFEGRYDYANPNVKYWGHKFKVVYDKKNPKRNHILYYERIIENTEDYDTCLLKIESVSGPRIAFKGKKRRGYEEISQVFVNVGIFVDNPNKPKQRFLGSNSYKYEGQKIPNLEDINIPYKTRKFNSKDNGKIFKGIYWKTNPHRFEIFFDEYYPNTTITDIEYNSEDIGDEFSKLATEVGENGTIYWVNQHKSFTVNKQIDSFVNAFIPRDSLGNEIKNVKIKLYPRDFCKSCPAG